MCIVPIPYPLEGPLGVCEDGDSHIATYVQGPGMGLWNGPDEPATPANFVACRNCHCAWQEPVKEDPRWPTESRETPSST